MLRIGGLSSLSPPYKDGLENEKDNDNANDDNDNDDQLNNLLNRFLSVFFSLRALFLKPSLFLSTRKIAFPRLFSRMLFFLIS